MTRRVCYSWKSFSNWLGLFDDDIFDPQARFTTSYLLSPTALASWRGIVALYSFISLVINYASNPGSYASFTVMSYWGIIAWNLMGAIHGFSFAADLKRWRAEQSSDKPGCAARPPTSFLTRSFPRTLQFLHLLLWSTICSFPLLVGVVFWVALSDGAFATPQASQTNVSVHILNFFLSALDILVIGRGPMLPWSHLGFIVLILGCYLGIIYIHLAHTGVWVYEFFDVNWNEGSVSAVGLAIFGIGAGGVVSCLFSQLFIFVRELIAARVQGSGGWGSARPRGVEDHALIPTKFGPGPEGEGGLRDTLVGENGWRQRWPDMETSGKGAERGEYELQSNTSGVSKA